MENHWHDIWNNRKINAEALESGDSQKIVLELKRLVGWDSQDKLGGYSGEAMYRELVKEYHYIKENLQPPPVVRFLRLGAAPAQISTSSAMTVFKSAVRTLRQISSLLPSALSGART